MAASVDPCESVLMALDNASLRGQMLTVGS